MSTLNRRPVLDIPLTRVDRIVRFASLVGLALLLGLPLFAWSGLPDEVPIHFGVSGDPTNWGSRWMVWFLPVVGLTMWICLTVLARYPHTYNYPVSVTEENAPHLYRLSRSLVLWLKTEILLCFAFIQWMMLRTAEGRSDGITAVFLLVYLALIFGTIGYFMWASFRAR